MRGDACPHPPAQSRLNGHLLAWESEKLAGSRYYCANARGFNLKGFDLNAFDTIFFNRKYRKETNKTVNV